MSFLHALLSLPREGLIISAVIVVGLFAVCVFALVSQRRYVTIKHSEETELLAFHLRRIADALEELSAARVTPPPVDDSPPKRVGMSAGR